MATSTATAPAPAAPVTQVTRRQFASRILRGSGAWPDTLQNEAALIAWMASENTAATWNPFASTYQSPPGSPYAKGVTTLAGNSAGVKNYPTPEIGINSFVNTLDAADAKGHKLYIPITAALAKSDGPGVVAAVSASPWGSHPTLDMYNSALSNPAMGDVVIGTGALGGKDALNSLDPGQAVPGLGIDLNPLSLFSKLVELIGSLFSWAVWKRVLGVLGGAILVGLGISLVRRDTFAQVAKDAGSVAEVVAVA